jgi:hypothetical protein
MLLVDLIVRCRVFLLPRDGLERKMGLRRKSLYRHGMSNAMSGQLNGAPLIWN